MATQSEHSTIARSLCDMVPSSGGIPSGISSHALDAASRLVGLGSHGSRELSPVALARSFKPSTPMTPPISVAPQRFLHHAMMPRYIALSISLSVFANASDNMLTASVRAWILIALSAAESKSEHARALFPARIQWCARTSSSRFTFEFSKWLAIASCTFARWDESIIPYALSHKI